MNGTADQLEVAVADLRGIPVASVRGEVDLDSSEVLERGLQGLRDARGPVIVDLTAVPFMDSSGLHVVVQLWRALRLEDRELAVACRGEVRKLFQLTALDGVLRLYEDAGDAARAVSGAPGLSSGS